MLLLLPLLLLAVSVPGARIARRGEFFDSLDRDYTGAVKGIFAVLIIFAHMLGYMETISEPDRLFSLAMSAFGQFTVVMFFFYSGAGVAISQAKKRDYRKTFFTRRIVKTLVHFAIAVTLYIPVSMLLGKSYTPGHIALAFTGWTSIGNSNWFVFAILALYLMTLAAFLLFPDKPLCSTAAVAVMCVGYIIVMRMYKDSFWYNTVLCYPLGMLAATVRPMGKKYGLRLCAATALTVAPLALYFFMPGADFQIFYIFVNCGFAYLTYLIGMKISIGNRALYLLGNLSFGIYILQRLPMSLLSHYVPGLPNIVFALISIAAAILLALPFTELTKLVDRLFFSRKDVRL